jgi:hypothetical protein
MNITLEITPEAQAELARQAALTGCGLEMHAASLLEEALHLPPQAQTSNEERKPAFGKSLVEVFDKARNQGLFDEGGLDFSRDPSPGREIDLA